MNDLEHRESTKPKGAIFSTLITVLIILGSGYLFFIKFLENPCELPVKYSIGNIDPRFKVAESAVKETVEDASRRWNQQVGENVLIYEQNADLKINLVYDERQAKIDKMTMEIGSLDSSGNAIDSFRQKIEKLISNYQNDLAKYDQDVRYWNSQGGAPEATFNQLERQQADLEKRRLSINESANLLNKQIDQHNSNLNQLNNEISQEKNKIITQGLYYPSEKKIDIFTFGNKEELRLVAMHELGHALSLGHDSQKNSILFPILGEQDLNNPALTDEDLQILKTSCKSPSGALKNLLGNFKNLYFSPQS